MKVAVVLGAAEVRELTRAEPEDAVDQRVRSSRPATGILAAYHQPVASCEIRLVNGDVFNFSASVEEAEKSLSDAARSGQSRLAWFNETVSGKRVGINPAHVASLRVSDTSG